MVVVIQEMGSPEAEQFLRSQVVGRVGCHVDGVTYVVPVIYAWDSGCAYVYSVEGQKVRMMRENPKVCFEVDEYQAGGGWRSAIVQGTYEELSGEDASFTLRLLAERFARRTGDGEGGGQRPRGEGRVPVAFRIRAEEVTGRKVDRSPPSDAGGQAGR
ncbi:MAG: pyridoxamine 5'-phosphate oxidase family protein [Actinomycetota bacterium]|jgi:nitroimidazol reductase NimA-like FMN-containing flavoprotein (pyridoxamine 5'-phosphate oxidase superfamily)|nr:pyridoxamine 5'-phosphate oxidase family protein [Actinomycetota bacterium]